VGHFTAWLGGRDLRALTPQEMSAYQVELA